MSCRLLRGPALEIVRPYVWRSSDGSAVKASASSSTGKRPLTALPEERTPALQASSAELELTVERRVKEALGIACREHETAARNKAAAEVRQVLEKLTQSIQDLAALRPKLRDQAEADIVKLALAIARRVVHRELATDPESIAGLVTVALSKLRAKEAVRVRVHPSHQSIVREMLSHSSASANIEVTGDSAADLGGVVFETTRGEFDVSVDVQLNEIEKGLTDRLAS
jgi:flagellar assembly protein FliH